MAYDLFEPIAARAKPWLGGSTVRQNDSTIAVAWRLTQFNSPGLIDPAHYPALAAFSTAAEALPEFIAGPLE